MKFRFLTTSSIPFKNFNFNFHFIFIIFSILFVTIQSFFSSKVFILKQFKFESITKMSSLSEEEKDRLTYLLQKPSLQREPRLKWEKVDLWEYAMACRELNLLLQKQCDAAAIQYPDTTAVIVHPTMARAQIYDVSTKYSSSSSSSSSHNSNIFDNAVDVEPGQQLVKHVSNNRSIPTILSPNYDDDDDNDDNYYVPMMRSRVSIDWAATLSNLKAPKNQSQISYDQCRNTIVNFLDQKGFFSFNETLNLSGILHIDPNTISVSKISQCRLFGKNEDSNPRHIHEHWLGK
jgi:hypothetical protein